MRKRKATLLAVPVVLSVPLSPQSVRHLEYLARHGIYGATAEEVAARFVDAALQEFMSPPTLASEGG